MMRRWRRGRVGRAIGSLALLAGVTAGVAASVVVSETAGAMGVDETLERSGTPDLGDGSSTVDITFGYDPQTRFRAFVNGVDVANGTPVFPGDVIDVQYDWGDNCDSYGAFNNLNQGYILSGNGCGERLFGESVNDLGNADARMTIGTALTGTATDGGTLFRLTNTQMARWGGPTTCGNSNPRDGLQTVTGAPSGNTGMSFSGNIFTWTNLPRSSCAAIGEFWDGFTARQTYTVQQCATAGDAQFNAGNLSLIDGPTMTWPTNDPNESQVFSLQLACPPKPPVCTDYPGSAVAGGPPVTFNDLLMQNGTAGVLDVGVNTNAYDPDYIADYTPGGANPDSPELKLTWVSPTSTQGGTLSGVTGVGGSGIPTFAGTSVTYTPPATLSGTDFIYYEIADQTGTKAMCRITILSPPPPIAATDNIVVDAWYGALNTPTSAGTDVDYTVDVTANDSDPLGGTMSWVLDSTTSAQGGTIVDNGGGSFTYTPAEGFCGDDTFTYTLNSTGPARTATGRVQVEVVCNTPPIAIDDTFTVVQGANVPAGTTVRPNDFDFEDPQSGFTYTVISPPSNASSFSLSATGVVTYVNDGTPGITSDSFTYEVCDNHAAEGAQTNPATLPRCTQATATILILEAPQAAPTAVADSGQVEAWYSTDGLGHAQTSIDVDLAANDSDTDGNLDPTTVSILTGPTAAQGVLTNNGDGTVTFEPTDGYAGLVTVVYQICDDPTAATPPAATALCASAPLLITVLGNTTPIGIADTATVPANDPGTVINVTFNDFDPNGDGVVVNSVDPASAQGGTVVNNNDGTVTYTPAAGFSGTDSFNYQLCDDHLAGADSTAVAINGSWPRCTSVTVTVEVVNSPPIANDDFATTPFQVPVDISIIGNDSDAEDGNTVPPLVTTVDPASQAGGTIVDNGDGTVTYTPPTGFCGLDTFGYTLTDSNGLTDTATVTVNVVCDQAPSAEDDSTNVAFQTPGTIDLTGNDSDPEDGTVTVDSVDAVSQEGGTVVDNGDGTATYTPPAGFCGLDQFDYVVTDTAGNLDTATVSINVTCINSDQDGDGIPDWVEIIVCGTPTCADGTEDTDGDGIPDYVEVIQCGTTTCINIEDNTDTDGDGIPDWVEIIVCGTPTCATGAEDSDGDGVPDWVEVIICGSTTCADSDTDSDGDGIPDWIEVIICGTPTCANPDDDSDGDGVPDWVEVIMCGSPTCATGDEDTDGDGVPDSIEIQICGTATCLDPATDSDGDGIPDYIEFLLCGSATCANGGEDTNNNGVPDWQEIQLCGSVGCVKDFLTNFDVGACTNTAPFTIPGTLDYDIPNGFRSNTKISIFMMSELLLVYQGPLPDTQKVTLSVPANTIPGNHKFMVVGVDDITGRVKVDSCFRKGELPAPVVKPMMQAPHPAGPGGGSTLVRTGTEAGPLVAAAAAMLALGAGLLLVVRRRRRGEA